VLDDPGQPPDARGMAEQRCHASGERQHAAAADPIKRARVALQARARQLRARPDLDQRGERLTFACTALPELALLRRQLSLHLADRVAVRIDPELRDAGGGQRKQAGRAYR
jgi:hypothetical protein